MDRYFEVVMLPVLANQQVVRVNLAHVSEQRAVEGAHRGPHWDVACSVRIVSHPRISFAPESQSRLMLPGHGSPRELRTVFQNNNGNPVRLRRKLGAQVISLSGTASRRSGYRRKSVSIAI